MIDLYGDLGFLQNLEKPGLFSNVPTNIQSNFNNGISQATIQSGESSYKTSLVDGYLQSSNFVTGVSGWRIDAEGNIEANDGTFRGALLAATIDIGGVDATSWHVDVDGNMWWGGAGSYALAIIKISAAGVAVFTSGAFSGNITGASGTFSGDITTDNITDSTYGFAGCFVKQIKTTSMSNENILIGPDNGGLLNISANYRSITTGYFWWLTPVNHFYVFKSGGNYYIYHAGAQIDTDTNADTVYYTCYFSSNESANGY